MPENPKPPTTPEESTATQPPQEKFCHIHDKVGDWEVDGIRENVCVSANEANEYGLKEHLNEFEGKHYCLFHLPTKEKDIAKFEEIFQARLEKTDKQCAEIEAVFPNGEDKQNEAKSKRNIKYDFRYVWFPSEVKFYNRKFSASADFRSATFSADANFSSATFSASADFRSATFSADAYFSSATFSASASFNSATFSASAYFISATFSADAYFSAATFDEKSQTYFSETRLCSTISFYKAEISGYIEFEGDIFCNAEKVKEIRTALKLPIEKHQEAILNLREIRLRNPERVSFNSTKLRPNWFVNVAEARKLEFNDVEWLNSEIDIDRTGLDKEIESLEERDVLRAERSLIKACNQLADNAEANRRFEEAERFRKQSIALEKKKCHIHDETDPRKKDDIREKVCQEYPVINEVGGNYYCLLHNPDHNKSEIFLKEFEKLKAEGHTDFRAVVFPITVEFVFPITDKKRGKVPDLDFSGATFLRRVVFDNAEINNLNFTSAFFTDISELAIKNSKCKGEIKFDKADIEGKLFIVGEYEKGKKERRQVFLKEKNALSMKDARIDKPHWINFRTINLLPHYFTEVDVSKIIFQDCKWRDNQGINFDTQKEIDISNYKEIAQTCNQLAINYEENRKYEESSVFRYAAMEANRRGYPSRPQTILNLYWLYKWTSGYGERRLWATLVLILLVAFFGILYATPFAKFEGIDNTKSVESVCNKYWIIGNQEGMRVCDGMIHSLAVASFQRPDPKPKDSFTKFLVTLETILAPLQAALLALAIRRKFMR
ncbi:MAG: pentapeptide repeat-containing protein [Pyrinomonadaceae bacterium]|nr:pentapeptide repeat-containing protein [Pyrinomonadaceae bacterium]